MKSKSGGGSSAKAVEDKSVFKMKNRKKPTFLKQEKLCKQDVWFFITEISVLDINNSKKDIPC